TDLGARIRTIEFPAKDVDLAGLKSILEVEAAIAHADHFPAKADRYGPALKFMLTQAAKLNAMDKACAYQARDRFTGRLRAVFKDVDLILTPGLGQILPTWAEVESWGHDIAGGDWSRVRLAQFTPPFNMAGIPTLSFPGGFTPEGLPVGLQLVGWKL